MRCFLLSMTSCVFSQLCQGICLSVQFIGRIGSCSEPVRHMTFLTGGSRRAVLGTRFGFASGPAPLNTHRSEENRFGGDGGASSYECDSGMLKAEGEPKNAPVLSPPAGWR